MEKKVKVLVSTPENETEKLVSRKQAIEMMAYANTNASFGEISVRILDE